MTSTFPLNLSLLRATRAAAAVVLITAAGGLAMAGPGHDGGDQAPSAGGTASPRIQAHSDLFELVGIVDNGQMTVYLDRYATNEPLTNASIEFEAGAEKGVAKPQADGSYLIKLDALAKPGSLPFSFTVAAGTDMDLLAGDLEIHGEPGHPPAAPARPWLRWLGYGLAILVALGIAALLLRRFMSMRRSRLNT
ncbi:MAG: hypothetical protein ABIQ90_17380 [Polaromonas sp.]